ncbi:MAG: divergent PAP2 family protein [Clostridia bacterium]|nr:divergent PAP2 family protein [Clostridia bacterium]
MEILLDLLQNRVFIAGILGWFIAQSAKVVIDSIKSKTFAKNRFNGSGGMPSSHSCMVTSMTIATAMQAEGGLGSVEFAIALVFTFVTLHDAMGVRWQAGLHARLLNKYMRDLQDNAENDAEEEIGDLKEFLGHRPIEVLVGVLLGILIAITVCLV